MKIVLPTFTSSRPSRLDNRKYENNFGNFTISATVDSCPHTYTYVCNPSPERCMTPRQIPGNGHPTDRKQSPRTHQRPLSIHTGPNPPAPDGCPPICKVPWVKCPHKRDHWLTEQASPGTGKLEWSIDTESSAAYCAENKRRQYPVSENFVFQISGIASVSNLTSFILNFHDNSS